MSSTTTLHKSTARTSSGAGPSMEGFGKQTTNRIQLAVTKSSGTLPTLQVFIEDSIDGGANWNPVCPFDPVTGQSVQAKNVPAPIGDLLRVRWVIGGTSPSFTFDVLAYTP